MPAEDDAAACAHTIVVSMVALLVGGRRGRRAEARECVCGLASTCVCTYTSLDQCVGVEQERSRTQAWPVVLRAAPSPVVNLARGNPVLGLSAHLASSDAAYII